MYREVSSCSLFGDFQSRRANIKFKSSDKKKYYPHTLNGSALAIGRTLAALIENHTKDNIIHIPDVLRVYTGFDSIKLWIKLNIFYNDFLIRKCARVVEWAGLENR